MFFNTSFHCCIHVTRLWAVSLMLISKPLPAECVLWTREAISAFSFLFFLTEQILFTSFSSLILEYRVPFTYYDCLFWMSPTHTGELLLQGPVFIREPSNSIFPVGSEDKKITLNCEARGNPSPHYRYSDKFANPNYETTMWQL